MGPGKYDLPFNLDGKNGPQVSLLPTEWAGINMITSTCDGEELAYWNRYVSVNANGRSAVIRVPGRPVPLMRAAIDAGVNVSDTCWDYQNHLSQWHLDKALADGHCQRTFSMTKFDARTQMEAPERIDSPMVRHKPDYLDLLLQVHGENPRILRLDGKN